MTTKIESKPHYGYTIETSTMGYICIEQRCVENNQEILLTSEEANQMAMELLALSLRSSPTEE